MTNKVVARFASGRLVKGVTLNVDLTKPSCHVRAADGTTHEVKFADLKALFFVKSLDGDPSHTESDSVVESDPRVRGSHVIEFRFRDGERLVALANRYPPLGALFFVVPADGKSNNIRILVNRSHVSSMDRLGKAA